MNFLTADFIYSQLFIYDVLQFILMIAASGGIILLYTDEDAKEAYKNNISTRQGLSVRQ